MSLWLAPAAAGAGVAQQVARSTLLEAAGIPVEMRPADLDERGLEAAAVAAARARLPRCWRARKRPPWRRLHPGPADARRRSDACARMRERFTKPADRAAARAQLRALRGRTHELHSALAFVQDGKSVRICRRRAADHARFFRSLSRRLSRRRRRRGDRKRRRLSDRRSRRSTVRADRRRLFHHIGTAADGSAGFPAAARVSAHTQ